jgi:hypothetical protein
MKEITMKLYRRRFALAVTLVALAAVSAVDSASAQFIIGVAKITISGPWRPGETMMLHKLRIALAATLVAVAAVSAVDSASAQTVPDNIGPKTMPNFAQLGPTAPDRSASAGWDPLSVNPAGGPYFGPLDPVARYPWKRRTKMLHKLRIALATIIVAAAAVSAVDSASAGFGRYGSPGYSVGYLLSTLP